MKFLILLTFLILTSCSSFDRRACGVQMMKDQRQCLYDYFEYKHLEINQDLFLIQCLKEKGWMIAK